MKTTPVRLLSLLAFFVAALALHAAEDPILAAVRAADDERVAATKSGEAKRLEAIYSDALRYAHSSGKIDTKQSYVRSLTTRATVYESYDYQTREFTPIAPGVVLMTGRVLIHSSNNGQKVENDLNFLGVWRNEGGVWRFVAWQSCKNPTADSTAKK
jgi:hypothetical protein